ncbi:MAG: alginate export family protein [Bacteroidales bacterium]|nr:alginate export family protein [Bacteroidales bacterium]
MRKTLVLGVLFYLTTNLIAQTKSELTVSGDFRTVTEYRQGYKALIAESSDPAFVISQRSRLILDYKSDKFDLRFSAQDARAWGETFIINNSKAILLHEAWIKYKFNNVLGIKIGRQSIKYGDSRIFSDRNWSIVGSAHDAAVFKYNKNGLSIDFGMAMNNNSAGILTAASYSINQYKSMSWIWATKTFSPKIKIHFVNLLAGYQKTGTLITYGLNTIGVNPIAKLHGFTFDGAAYFQFGKNGTGNNHQAHIYTANLSYTYQFISAKAGYDHYSGKDFDDTSNTDRDFKQITETIPHCYFGFMDFYKGPQFRKKQGISDINFNIKYGKKTRLTAYFHALSYTKKPGTDLSKKIGNEFDFVLTHKFAANHSLDIGYSFMLPHDDLITTALGPNTDAAFAQWAWVRLTFKPKLL